MGQPTARLLVTGRRRWPPFKVLFACSPVREQTPSYYIHFLFARACIFHFLSSFQSSAIGGSIVRRHIAWETRASGPSPRFLRLAGPTYPPYVSFPWDKRSVPRRGRHPGNTKKTYLEAIVFASLVGSQPVCLSYGEGFPSARGWNGSLEGGKASLTWASDHGWDERDWERNRKSSSLPSRTLTLAV